METIKNPVIAPAIRDSIIFRHLFYAQGCSVLFKIILLRPSLVSNVSKFEYAFPPSYIMHVKTGLTSNCLAGPRYVHGQINGYSI